MDEQGQDQRRAGATPPPAAHPIYAFCTCVVPILIAVVGLVFVVFFPGLQTRTDPSMLDRLAEAKWGKVKADLYTINMAIVRYAISNRGSFPDSLGVLILTDRHGKKLLKRDSVPKDPWGNEYVYEPPIGSESHRVICYGADGVPGGDPNSDDRDYDTVMLRYD